jgi:hypothetical protein
MHGNADIAHAQVGHYLLFVGLGMLADLAQIDHGFDALGSHLLKPSSVGWAPR